MSLSFCDGFCLFGQFVKTAIWRSLFGKEADALEQSTGNDNECIEDSLFSLSLSNLFLSLDMIREKSPLTNRFVSVPKDLGKLNCAAMIAGIIRGVLVASDFVRTFFCIPRSSQTHPCTSASPVPACRGDCPFQPGRFANNRVFDSL